MNHIGLFEGIGGFSIAAQMMGWKTIAWVEKNEFCQKVLNHHFPNAKGYGDIKTSNLNEYEGIADIVTGGFPCQPFSVAGGQGGSDDDRELSQEMLRQIGVIKPRWVVAENVGNILNEKFKTELNLFCSGLENIGYQEPLIFDCSADSIGLSTMERHIWIITQANEKRCKRGIKKTFQDKRVLQGEFSRGNQRELHRWELPESRVCGMGKGVSEGLDTDTISKSAFHRKSLEAYGNAITPQVAFEIFKVIQVLED